MEPEANQAAKRALYKSEPQAVAGYERLADWSSMARGAFAANTLRAWKADWEIFGEFCLKFRLEPLPASAKAVRDFVFECLSNNKKPATIRRYVSTIGRAHRASGVLDPTASEEVKLALKEMGRKAPARQRQARGLTWAEIELFLSVSPRNLRDIRDRALVTVAYDTMCRREELVSLRVEDIAEARLRQDVATDEVREASRARAPDSPLPGEGRSPNSPADGEYSGSILIRRSKTDTTGEGATAYLSPLTMRLVAEWTKGSGLKTGPLFVRVVGSNTVGGALTAQIVTAVLRKVGQWIGLDREEWERISGHSARVGAAQDLLALNIDLSSVMQAGRWRDTRMPMRYGRKYWLHVEAWHARQRVKVARKLQRPDFEQGRA